MKTVSVGSDMDNTEREWKEVNIWKTIKTNVTKWMSKGKNGRKYGERGRSESTESKKIIWILS